MNFRHKIGDICVYKEDSYVLVLSLIGKPINGKQLYECFFDDKTILVVTENCLTNIWVSIPRP